MMTDFTFLDVVKDSF